jgi:copper chaperone
MFMKKLFVFLPMLLVFACTQTTKHPENSAGPDSLHMAEYVLDVEGMTCGGCENSIEKAMATLDGVAMAKASHTNGNVLVCTDTLMTPVSEVVKAIESKGYNVAGFVRQ